MWLVGGDRDRLLVHVFNCRPDANLTHSETLCLFQCTAKASKVVVSTIQQSVHSTSHFVWQDSKPKKNRKSIDLGSVWRFYADSWCFCTILTPDTLYCQPILDRPELVCLHHRHHHHRHHHHQYISRYLEMFPAQNIYFLHRRPLSFRRTCQACSMPGLN